MVAKAPTGQDKKLGYVNLHSVDQLGKIELYDAASMKLLAAEMGNPLAYYLNPARGMVGRQRLNGYRLLVVTTGVVTDRRLKIQSAPLRKIRD